MRLGAALFAMIPVGTMAQEGLRMIEDFSGAPAERWEFISDQVMGGVSTGRVSVAADGERSALHLEGSVSTKNNGGFIQARLKLPCRLPKEAIGLELEVRGNGQTYYVHARSGGTILPWNFYQAPFDAAPEWTVLRIPLTGFTANGLLLRDTLQPDAIKSIAIVAFGRNHTADISLARIGYY